MKKFLRVLRWLCIVFGIYVLVAGGYFYYSLATAEVRVRPLCAQIKTGMPFSDLEIFSRSNGFTAPRKTSDSNIAFIVEGRSYGRHGCMITFDGDFVKAAEYSFQD